jgi:hypothetical protein
MIFSAMALTLLAIAVLHVYWGLGGVWPGHVRESCARGAAGFTPWWRRLMPGLPFARNDRRCFSPLCLAIGAGFGILTLEGIPA